MEDLERPPVDRFSKAYWIEKSKELADRESLLSWPLTARWRRLKNDYLDLDRRERTLALQKRKELDDLKISITSYPARFDGLAQTLRSLALQHEFTCTLELRLYTGDACKLPEDVLELERTRKIQIRLLPVDLKSHKKLLPQSENPQAVITADDDFIYPPHWLATIIKHAKKYPDAVVALRAHWVGLKAGKIRPYNSWEMDLMQGGVHSRFFPTTGAGVYFPPKFGDRIFWDAEKAMLDAGTADDVWCYAAALRSDRKIFKVPGRVMLIPRIHGGGESLWQINQIGENDEAIRRVVEPCQKKLNFTCGES